MNAPGRDEVPASVDENDVTGRVIDQRGGVERQDGDTVLQQPEGGKDLSGGLPGGGHQDEIHMRLQGGMWICRSRAGLRVRPRCLGNTKLATTPLDHVV